MNSVMPSSDNFRSVSPVRGIRLFRAISRRLARRSADDLDSRSSSSDSKKEDSSSSSEADSADGVRRVLQNLDLNSKEKKKAAPKRILRSPVTYTYVKGLSGLPTQRVPQARVYSACGCSVQYMAGLNR